MDVFNGEAGSTVTKLDDPKNIRNHDLFTIDNLRRSGTNSAVTNKTPILYEQIFLVRICMSLIVKNLRNYENYMGMYPLEVIRNQNEAQ